MRNCDPFSPEENIDGCRRRGSILDVLVCRVREE
jgi:hypothetical protein